MIWTIWTARDRRPEAPCRLGDPAGELDIPLAQPEEVLVRVGRQPNGHAFEPEVDLGVVVRRLSGLGDRVDQLHAPAEGSRAEVRVRDVGDHSPVLDALAPWNRWGVICPVTTRT